MDLPSNELKVSVCVITYNQEAYIRQCLQSIVDQETNFKFEVIVGDDNSSDNTANIIREFAAKYPRLIKPIFQPENVGSGCNNYRTTHRAAVGEYVAHMDGDDCMLDGKLQAQADFLDDNPECSMVAHKSLLIVDGDVTTDPHSDGSRPKFSDIFNLLEKHTFFRHSTKMYRRAATPDNTCLDDEIFIDFALHLEHARWGPIGFINEPYALYRKLPGSITTASGEKLYLLIDKTLDAFLMAAGMDLDRGLVGRRYCSYSFKAALFCLERDDAQGFLRYVQISRLGSIAQPNRLHSVLDRLQRFPEIQIRIGKVVLWCRAVLRRVLNYQY